MKKISQTVFNIGLFAGLPAGEGDYIARAVDALVAGGIQGVILSWNKHLFPVVEQVRATHKELMIGIQGPYAHSGQLFASGANFVIDTANVPARIQIPFFLRRGNDILEGDKILAQCTNKLVFVSDLKQQKWDEITLRAQHAIKSFLGFELRHVGINHPDASAAQKTADQFERFFGFAKTDKDGAYFAGSYIEAMKKSFYGTHGHIAIATNNAARAAWYLTQRGAQFNWKSADYNPDGSLLVVYLQDEIAGFAVHIVQK